MLGSITQSSSGRAQHLIEGIQPRRQAQTVLRATLGARDQQGAITVGVTRGAQPADAAAAAGAPPALSLFSDGARQQDVGEATRTVVLFVFVAHAAQVGQAAVAAGAQRDARQCDIPHILRVQLLTGRDGVEFIHVRR